ncbi:MAG: YihY/virulence factor BrkB family protein, partial [Planctomycetota bacterium]
MKPGDRRHAVVGATESSCARSEMKKQLRRLIRFLTVEIWRLRLSDLPKGKSVLIKALRTIVLALRDFKTDRCTLRASALTFYSMLSIVPLVAMAYGLAKGFGFEHQLETRLMAAFEGREEVAKWILEWSQNMLKQTRGGLVAGIGVAILLWTVIKVLGNIEKSFNDIWGTKKNRTLLRKFSDYLSVVLVCPVLLVLSGSATVVLSTMIKSLSERLGFLAPVIVLLLSVLPYLIGWFVFGFIYMFVPNTRVKFKSALVAGVIAGTAFQVMQWGYVNFQVGVTRYSAVYGSFAALPLFLIWLQLSWLIVLFGAELSFAHQNAATYEFEPDCARVSRSFKLLIALRAAQVVVRNFAEGERPLMAAEVSQRIGAPIRLVNEVLLDLEQAGVLTET